MSMSAAARLQPPVETPAIDPTTQDHSPAWARHHQRVTDRLADLQSQIDAITSTAGVGVTDGSEAAAGHVGEYLTATGSAVALTSGTNTTVVSLTLQPGDWQVDGNVFFTPSAGAHATRLAAAIGTSATVVFNATDISTTFAAGFGTLLSVGYPTRFNVTAATTVYVVAAASFTGGTMTAQGRIEARRMR